MKNSQNQRRIYIFSLIMLSESTLRCKIFGFCLLSFPQNERKIYKLRQLSLFQFVYFLREVCLLFNFGMMKVNFINQKWKSKHTSPKNIVSVCIFFSRFEGMRGDKNLIFRTRDCWISALQPLFPRYERCNWKRENNDHNNGILLPKLFWPTMRKTFDIRD